MRTFDVLLLRNKEESEVGVTSIGTAGAFTVGGQGQAFRISSISGSGVRYKKKRGGEKRGSEGIRCSSRKESIDRQETAGKTIPWETTAFGERGTVSEDAN